MWVNHKMKREPAECLAWSDFGGQLAGYTNVNDWTWEAVPNMDDPNPSYDDSELAEFISDVESLVEKAAHGDGVSAWILANMLVPDNMVVPPRYWEIYPTTISECTNRFLLAFKLLQDEAAGGNGISMCYLGTHYSIGLPPVSRNSEKSVEWFLRALDAGCARAANDLHIAYSDKYSPLYDEEKARYYRDLVKGTDYDFLY